MKGILLALLAGLLFAGYQFAIKLSANHIQELLGAVILQAVALLLGIIAFFLFRETHLSIEMSSKGLQFAIIAGIFVGLAEIVSFYVFATNISPSVGITLIVGVNILAGVLLDYFWLKSDLSATQMVGIVFVLLGVIFICWKR